MAGWRPVGRLVGLAGAVSRRLSWGPLCPSRTPGGPCAVGCGAGMLGGQVQGWGQAGTDRHRMRWSLFGLLPVSLRCARGAAAGSLPVFKVSLRGRGGGGGLPGGRVQRGAWGGRHVDVREELVGL